MRMTKPNNIMTLKDIDNAPNDSYDEALWKPLIDFFVRRYTERYFAPIKALQTHSDYKVRNNCGFLIASIDCILIETLEQYYSGTDKTQGKNHEPLLSFFLRTEEFKHLNINEQDAGKFAGYIRAALLHQSKTIASSVINKKSSTPILGWIDPLHKQHGFKINRDKFHHAVESEFYRLIEKLKSDESILLRNRFKQKMQTLI